MSDKKYWEKVREGAREQAREATRTLNSLLNSGYLEAGEFDTITCAAGLLTSMDREWDDKSEQALDQYIGRNK